MSIFTFKYIGRKQALCNLLVYSINMRSSDLIFLYTQLDGQSHTLYWTMHEARSNHSVMYEAISLLSHILSIIFSFFRILWPPMVSRTCAMSDWVQVTECCWYIYTEQNAETSKRWGRRRRRLCRWEWFITKYNDGQELGLIFLLLHIFRLSTTSFSFAPFFYHLRFSCDSLTFLSVYTISYMKLLP